MIQYLINAIDKCDHMFLKFAINSSVTIVENLDCYNIVYITTNDYLKPSHKIGCTTNGIKRISQLKNYGVYTKEAITKKVFCYDDPKLVERIFHRIFTRGHGIGREWFNLFEWDLHWIESLGAIDTHKLESIIVGKNREIIQKSRFIQLKGSNDITSLDKEEKDIFNVGNLVLLKYTKNNEMAYLRYGVLK